MAAEEMNNEMPEITSKPKGSKPDRDPDFVNADAAMKRAAQKARRRARQAGIGVMVIEDGKIIEDKT